jgi:phosphosulfolactate synthase (CoM biosynthesis protein A)
LLPRAQVKSFSHLAHRHGAYVSSGGWIETVLRYGAEAVEKYLDEAKAVVFDVIEISTGFLSIPTSGLLRLVEQVKKAGFKRSPSSVFKSARAAIRPKPCSRLKARRTSAISSSAQNALSMPARTSS